MYYNRCMVYRLQIIIIMTTKNKPPPPRVVRKTDDRDGAENDAPPLKRAEAWSYHILRAFWTPLETGWCDRRADR